MYSVAASTEILKYFVGAWRLATPFQAQYAGQFCIKIPRTARIISFNIA